MNKKPLLLISFLLFIFSWVLPNSSFAQLDSTTATISVVENYYQAIDSLDERDMAVLTLTFDDISDVGYVNVVVINIETGNVVQQILSSRIEMETSGVLFSDRLEFALFEPLPNTLYRVEISPMNLIGAYTKMCFLSLSV
ncbi:MAG: hypothetical protein HYZ43_03580 [Flavobacteriia bacterium]|nr:hypothetical protein [Flavobacteriia bacterium]